jgi:ATPase subunit of ABC transporter with duplicated ATPase domains
MPWIRARDALVVVTHDRWFLDAVCTATWEVVDEQVHAYEGGYAAWTLARAVSGTPSGTGSTARSRSVTLQN